jgi:hypothetical protein
MREGGEREGKWRVHARCAARRRRGLDLPCSGAYVVPVVVHVCVVPCAALLVLSFIWRGLSHLERFEFVLASPCLPSRLPLTSWVPLSSFLPCVLVLPFALFY